ncbi:MAG: hypothetical protein JW881_19415 [Spirochaetales bacterium]|nr:hypothetical protein [Spirochaetales bacterium]
MSKKRKIKGTIIFAFILYVFYLLVFPFPTGKEIVVYPHELYHLSEAAENIPDVLTNEKPGWFRNADHFGYIDGDGRLIYKDTVLYNVTLSENGFINYSSIQDENQAMVFFNPYGEFISSFNNPGYPLFSGSGDRLFLVKTNATGLCEITFEGEKIWEAEFASILTGFSAGSDIVAVGLLNGIINIFDRSGKCIHTIESRESRLSVIYGCLVSNTGRYIAALYGIDKQKLVIIEKKNMKFSGPVYFDTGTAFRRPVILRFSPFDRFLFIEGEKELLVFDVKARIFHSIVHRGELIDICPLTESDMVVCTSRGPLTSNNKTEITFFIPPAREVIRTVCGDMNIRTGKAGGFLTFCTDDDLLVCEVTER